MHGALSMQCLSYSCWKGTRPVVEGIFSAAGSIHPTLHVRERLEASATAPGPSCCPWNNAYAAARALCLKLSNPNLLFVPSPRCAGRKTPVPEPQTERHAAFPRARGAFASPKAEPRHRCLDPSLASPDLTVAGAEFDALAPRGGGAPQPKKEGKESLCESRPLRAFESSPDL